MIFEEFKGTGNAEIVLDREIAERRIFPAINIERSATRREELLFPPETLDKVHQLRRALHSLPPVDAIQLLLKQMADTKTQRGAAGEDPVGGLGTRDQGLDGEGPTRIRSRAPELAGGLRSRLSQSVYPSRYSPISLSSSLRVDRLDEVAGAAGGEAGARGRPPGRGR